MSKFWGTGRSKRGKLLTIRVTDEERERADFVAKHHRTNVARLVRHFFYDEAKKIADAEKEKAESVQNATKSDQSRAPRPPPGLRPTKSARKAPAGRPPRAGKARKRARR